MIKYASSFTALAKRLLSPSSLAHLDRYGSYVQRRFSSGNFNRDFFVRVLRWVACMVVVVTIFMVSGAKVHPWLASHIDAKEWAQAAGWLLSFTLGAIYLGNVHRFSSSTSPCYSCESGRNRSCDRSV